MEIIGINQSSIKSASTDTQPLQSLKSISDWLGWQTPISLELAPGVCTWVTRKMPPRETIAPVFPTSSAQLTQTYNTAVPSSCLQSETECSVQSPGKVRGSSGISWDVLAPWAQMLCCHQGCGVKPMPSFGAREPSWDQHPSSALEPHLTMEQQTLQELLSFPLSKPFTGFPRLAKV